jgi:hypothetical protein
VNSSSRGKSLLTRLTDYCFKVLETAIDYAVGIRWGKVLDFGLVFLAILSIVLLSVDLLVLAPQEEGLTNRYKNVLDYEYRTAIHIDNKANSIDLKDYQILLQIDTARLISAGKLRSDCADIRFTDSDEIKYLSYWIESGINTNCTNIWVKVPRILAHSKKTIYMYYGNNNKNVKSLSDGHATFVFFDDFERAEPGEAWQVVGAGPQFGIVKGKLRVNGYQEFKSGYGTTTAFSTTPPIAIEYIYAASLPDKNMAGMFIAGMVSSTLPYSAETFELLDEYGVAIASDGENNFSYEVNMNGSKIASYPINPENLTKFNRVKIELNTYNTSVSIGTTSDDYAQVVTAKAMGMATNVHIYFVSNASHYAEVETVFVRNYGGALPIILSVERTNWFVKGERITTLILCFIWIDLIICEIFFIEFFTRTVGSKEPKKYARRHWFDILGMIPVSHPALRAFRLLRILRLFIVFTRLKVSIDKAYGEGVTRRFIRRYKELLADEVTNRVMIKMIELVEAELAKTKYQRMLTGVTSAIESRRAEIKRLAVDAVDKTLDKQPLTRLIKLIPFASSQIKRSVDDSVDAVMDMLRSEEINKMILEVLKSVLTEMKKSITTKEEERTSRK